MKFSLKKFPYRLFWIGLVFSTIFSSYRYPFKMATSTTSPTYSDTPIAIQGSKFVAILSLCFLCAAWTLTTPVKVWRSAMILAIVFLECLPLVKLFYGYDASYIDQTFWPLAAMVLVLGVRKVSTKSLDSFMRFLLFYSLITDAIQVILFLSVGRLPSQGYPDSIVVRFGAWLDAPNDFACLIFLLMGWAFYRYQSTKRIIIQVLLFICLILTQSLTAYLFFALLIFVVGILQIVRRPKSILWIAFIFGLVVLITYSWIPSIFRDLMENKSTSIAGHIESPAQWFGNWSSWIFTGTSSHVFFEDWWLSSLINFGILWFCVCVLSIGILFFSVAIKFRCAANVIDKSVLCGILLLSVYCILGAANLPTMLFFPINYIFYTLCFLVFFDKLGYVSNEKLALKATQYVFSDSTKSKLLSRT